MHLKKWLLTNSRLVYVIISKDNSFYRSINSCAENFCRARNMMCKIREIGSFKLQCNFSISLVLHLFVKKTSISE